MQPVTHFSPLDGCPRVVLLSFRKGPTLLLMHNLPNLYYVCCDLFSMVHLGTDAVVGSPMLP